jgi:antitoxin HigA-1
MLNMEERLPNIHPGEVLEEEFLKPLHIPASRLIKELRVPAPTMLGILQRKRRITPNIALRLAKFFGTSAQFWLGLQMDYDLEEEQHHLATRLEKIHAFQGVVHA